MKKVAAYCRVSTEQDDQLNSLENQKTFFENYINKNLEWTYVGIYVDEGISGTNINKRSGFKQMIKDAENGKFDLLLTKEISRFARNTLDSIFYTRKLKSLGIGVYFMNDNINTLDPDSELRLTIMASIAQEESRKTSDRVKWGHKRQMEKGVVFGNGIYGYNLENGKLTINEEQAKIVQYIFSSYLDEGMGVYVLCHDLENKGILSPSRSKTWKNASILRMLKNEKYIGTLKQKKYITVDFLSHKKVPNEGEEEFIIIENNHEPIIDKETFYKVQAEIARRRNFTLDKSRHSNRYVWSGKIECAICGAKFKRKIWNAHSSNPHVVWQCATNVKYGAEKELDTHVKVGCNSKAVYEEILQEAFLEALSGVIQHKDRIIRELKQAITEAISHVEDHTEEIQHLTSEAAKLESRKTKLIELYTDGAISRAEFDQLNDQYMRQLDTLQNEQQRLASDNQKKEDLKGKMDKISAVIDSIILASQFSDEVCKAVLVKVVIQSRENISFFLTSEENTPDIFIPLSVTLSLSSNQKGYSTSKYNHGSLYSLYSKTKFDVYVGI